MRDRDMKRLLSMVGQLTFNQRSKLRDELYRQSAKAEVTQAIEGQRNESPQCPHCRCGHVVRNGQADGLQRYKCRGCGKTFNALSGTPMARLRARSVSSTTPSI